MKVRGIFKVLGTIIILLVIMCLSLLIIKNNKVKIKEQTGKQVTVLSRSIKPIKKATLSYGNIKKYEISSSSKNLIQCIVDRIPSSGWTVPGENPSERLSLINERKKIKKNQNGNYYIYIPKDAADLITELNFSGKNLGNLSVIPNFTQFARLKKLNFSNCNITNIDGFKRQKFIKNLNEINLEGNSLRNPLYSAVLDGRFKFKNQKISISLGSVNKYSILSTTLPSIFVTAYGGYYPAPKKFIPYGKCKIEGIKITFDTSIADTNNIVSVKIDDANSRFNGSVVYFSYRVNPIITRINSNNNNNKNNNNNITRTSSRRKYFLRWKCEYYS